MLHAAPHHDVPGPRARGPLRTIPTPGSSARPEGTPGGPRPRGAGPSVPLEADLLSAEAVVAAFRSIPGVSVLVLDAQHRFRTVAGEAFGYAADDLLGLCAPSILPPTTWHGLVDGVGAALAGRRSRATVRELSGEGVLETTFEPVRREDRVIGAVVIVRDVTAEHRRDAELAELSEVAALAFDGVDRPQALLSPDGRLTRVNAAMCAFLNRTPDALTGADLRLLAHPEDAGRDLAERRRLVAGDTDDAPFAMRWVLPDGRAVRSHVVLTLVRRPDGEARGFLLRITPAAG